jgi:16S rRNA (adenine1518-N6/adenine1519-N6)-dimethyltransferase
LDGETRRAPHPRRELDGLDLKARKRLGQNFLTDAGALRKIVAAAELSSDDTVIEVGPGLGALTTELVRAAGRVVAVELDENLAAALKEKFAGAANLTVVRADILRVAPAELLDIAGKSSYKVVANLPYYIASAVLRYFLEAAARPELMVVMLQREVARAITASPGQMSLLSLSVQLYGEPKIIARVPAGSFYPVPGVESAILRVKTYPGPLVAADDTAGFFTLARAAFCAPRKQLLNTLVQGLDLPKEQVAARLAGAALDGKRRAETLSLPEWSRLWAAFKEAVA